MSLLELSKRKPAHIIAMSATVRDSSVGKREVRYRVSCSHKTSLGSDLMYLDQG